ncbi:MAG: hypothetical protein R2827_05585 [Bdellovibrionales bacterium]
MILAQESEETRKMLEIYARHSQGKATPEEVKKARRQFVDIVKTASIGFYALLPFTLLTIPVFVRLGRRFGIEILPTSFSHLVPKDSKQPIKNINGEEKQS